MTATCRRQGSRSTGRDPGPSADRRLGFAHRRTFLIRNGRKVPSLEVGDNPDVAARPTVLTLSRVQERADRCGNPELAAEAWGEGASGVRYHGDRVAI